MKSNTPYINTYFNKSIATNVVAVFIIFISYLPIAYSQIWSSVGFFALSGALTNWIAIYMLFEKVPFLYGSGVIPARFEDFKKGIKQMVMREFFTPANVERVLLSKGSVSVFDISHIEACIDYDQFFKAMVEAILASSFGGMLSLIGGEARLEGLRAPFKEKMQDAVRELANSEAVHTRLMAQTDTHKLAESLVSKIEHVVDDRLAMLSPQMVKKLVEEIIAAHLGWLVVWGGVFGGLLGLIKAISDQFII